MGLFNGANMATNTVRNIPAHINRADKPSKHASMWNAMASRRAEMNKNIVVVTTKKVTK
jgi:hypothetical protein